MIDFHTHILPGVDDGSPNLETSIKMLQRAKDIGVTHIVLTPHLVSKTSWFTEKDKLQNIFNEFVEKVKDIGVKLYLGSEIYFSEKNYKKLLNGELTTFNNSKVCLVEFPMHAYTEIEELIYNIRVNGFYPILAHPERYKYLKWEDVESIREHAYIQVNSTSILGTHGRKVKKAVFELLKRKLVDIVSSDAHNDEERCINLDKSYKIVKKKFGQEYADKIFRQNQEKIIKMIDEEAKF